LALQTRYDAAAEATLFDGGGWGYTISAVDSETALYTMGAMYRSTTSELALSAADSTGWDQVGSDTVNTCKTRVISSGFGIGFLDDKASVGLSATQWKRTATVAGSGSGWRFTGGLSGFVHSRVIVAVDASVPAFDDGARGLEGETLIQGGVRVQALDVATVYLASLSPIGSSSVVMAGVELGPVELAALRLGASRALTMDTVDTSFGVGVHSDAELVGFDVSASVQPSDTDWVWTWSGGGRLRF
jgi:hypothetical protein